MLCIYDFDLYILSTVSLKALQSQIVRHTSSIFKIGQQYLMDKFDRFHNSKTGSIKH